MENGVPLYLGGTDTHIVAMNLGPDGHSGKSVERHLAEHGLLANAVDLPDDRRLAVPMVELTRAHPIPDEIAPSRSQHIWNQRHV